MHSGQEEGASALGNGLLSFTGGRAAKTGRSKDQEGTAGPTAEPGSVVVTLCAFSSCTEQTYLNLLTQAAYQLSFGANQILVKKNKFLRQKLLKRLSVLQTC